MKANIHGIEVEGTPKELVEFKLHIERQINDAIDKLKDYKVPVYTYPHPLYFPPVLISDPATDPFKWNQVTCKQDTVLMN
ncbi:hypothetical protein D3C74_448410 [compost metagenome]